ncbi:hypothetical protein [Bacillus wiedmannii]|uniref:hypothetical protein n=1 Tax=Bacillus wiedmannii TaxID=1890302 RepID=UPI0025A29AEA|nr:hypothetical protein [Bacillus wiedmannii]MDM5266939.1 hypothetical protein [Bacillus wiedmannii]
MRQIKVELEKDWKHCPKKLMDEFAKEERDWINSIKKGNKKKRYKYTKRKPFYTNCTECGYKLSEWDEKAQSEGVCCSSCYMSSVGMSWSDFI